MAKRESDAEWLARVQARHAEWDRLAREAEDAAQERLNARCPASEGWQGAEERRGFRIRAVPAEEGPDLGAFI